MKKNLDGKTMPLLAAGAGLAVANTYYSQPMLAELSIAFGTTPAVVAAIPMAALTGNTLGVIFLAPLGDKFERRALIVLTTVALALGLLGASIATTLWLLIAASFMIGLFSTVAQQIVSLAVHIAPIASRGQALGLITGAILLGILLSRTISGGVTEWWGWRAMFLAAAGAMFAMALLFAWRLPKVHPKATPSYAALLGSLWLLLAEHRTLRIAVLIQALIFAAFLAFWSNLAVLLAGEPYQLGPSATGMMAVIGAVGVAAAPAAGRLADRGDSRRGGAGHPRFRLAHRLARQFMGACCGRVADGHRCPIVSSREPCTGTGARCHGAQPPQYGVYRDHASWGFHWGGPGRTRVLPFRMERHLCRRSGHGNSRAGASSNMRRAQQKPRMTL